MTTNREAMTLERQAFEEWYAINAHNYFRDPIGSRDCAIQWEAWQAAIANLSRAAEPVYQAQYYEDDFWHWGDVSESEYKAADPERRRILYTHPSEPARDAKDAARYRWLRDCNADQENAVMLTPDKPFQHHAELKSGDDLDAAIDAAMAQESPDAK